MTTPEVRTCPDHDLPLDLMEKPTDARLTKRAGVRLAWVCPVGHEVTVAKGI